MDRRLKPDVQLSMRMFVTMLLLAAVYLAFGVVLFEYGRFGALNIVVILGGMLALQYIFADKLVLASMGARVVSADEYPELHAMVTRLASTADLPAPKVAVMKTPMPNAFATGKSPNKSVVAVTTGIMERLEPQELEAVLAHELAHIKHRDVMVITLAGFFSTLASIIVQRFLFIGFYGGFGGRRDNNNGANPIMVIYLASIVVWVLSFLLIRALSRYREFAADRGSAILTGAPSNLSSALIKISGEMDRIPDRDLRQAEGANAFFILPAVSKRRSLVQLLSTHPSLDRRLEQLRKLEAQLR